MSSKIKQEVSETPASAPEVPRLIIRSGNSTLIIGLHFSDTGKDTVDDKMKQIIVKRVKDGDF